MLLMCQNVYLWSKGLSNNKSVIKCLWTSVVFFSFGKRFRFNPFPNNKKFLSHIVFKRLVLQTHKNQGLFVKGLIIYFTSIEEQVRHLF